MIYRLVQPVYLQLRLPVKDMHALEQDRQEVVQRHQEGVGPLAGKVRPEGRVLLRGRDEGQDEPVAPLGLTLQLQRLLLEELLRLLQVSFLHRSETGLKLVRHKSETGQKRIKNGSKSSQKRVRNGSETGHALSRENDTKSHKESEKGPNVFILIVYKEMTFHRFQF